MPYKALFVVAFFALLIIACRPTDDPNIDLGRDLTHLPYHPTAYSFPAINGLPAMEVPADNPMTVEGIRLGRHLFYDPILSLDSTISCSTCHQQEKAFTDGLAVSKGIHGQVGKRSAMSLINVGYSWIQSRDSNFMWDGRFKTLEDQVIKGPLIDPLEMANTWQNLENSLRNHPTYPALFREAFGITNTNELKTELVGKAIAQFERTLNSTQSLYDEDLVQGNFVYMSTQAKRGHDLFMGDAINSPIGKDAECAHCHSISANKVLFARNAFTNNGLDSVIDASDFLDYGLGGITGKDHENGLFREVTLRNIALTAPYMHDGRFETLEEVMEHYVHGISTNRRINLASELKDPTDLFQLTQTDKEDIIAFLHALTDTSYIHKEAWSSPFD